MLQDIMSVEMVTGWSASLSYIPNRVQYSISYRAKNVAFGSGLAIKAMSNIRLPREALKLRPADKPLITTSLVKFLPSRGRKPWFASVFIMGQGPRTVQVSFNPSNRNRRTYGHSCQQASIGPLKPDHNEGGRQPVPGSG